jgi:hypothetical protein
MATLQPDDVVRFKKGPHSSRIFTVKEVRESWNDLTDKNAWGNGGYAKDLDLLFRPSDDTLRNLLAVLTKSYDDAADWKDAKPQIIAMAHELAELYFPDLLIGECVDCGNPTPHKDITHCDECQEKSQGDDYGTARR